MCFVFIHGRAYLNININLPSQGQQAAADGDIVFVAGFIIEEEEEVPSSNEITILTFDIRYSSQILKSTPDPKMFSA